MKINSCECSTSMPDLCTQSLLLPFSAENFKLRGHKYMYAYIPPYLLHLNILPGLHIHPHCHPPGHNPPLPPPTHSPVLPATLHGLLYQSHHPHRCIIMLRSKLELRLTPPTTACSQHYQIWAYSSAVKPYRDSTTTQHSTTL